MRIVTRPDFDGIVCAVLIYEAEDITEPIKWVEPSDMQKGLVDIRAGDIIANLPYHENCSLWFDHHYTNRIDKPFNGRFKIAPSAAGIVYEYYFAKIQRDFKELVQQTDKIDSANLTLDEVLYPERYEVILLSMTLAVSSKSDESYWNRMVDLLRTHDVHQALQDDIIKQRCQLVVELNQTYKKFLSAYTRMEGPVSITDFRSFDKAPKGNRFLVYSLFPDSIVNVKIRYDEDNKDFVIVNVGHSIFNMKCNVNVGQMLSMFEGGGHRGAGACKFHVSKSETYIPAIINILKRNEEVFTP